MRLLACSLPGWRGPTFPCRVLLLEVCMSCRCLFRVTTDQQLKFSDHIENAVKKANRVLGCLATTSRHLNKETFLLLYNAMVRPHLEYASCVWCLHLKKTDLIEQVQRRASRHMPETKGLPYNSRLKELQLPTLSYRKQRTSIIHTFTIVSKELDSVNQDCRCSQYPSKLMFQKASGITRGHSEKIQTRGTTSSRQEWLKCGTLCQTTQFRPRQ